MDINRQTALHFACTIGSEPIVNQLLKYGTPLDIFSNKDYTPLHITTIIGKERIVTMPIDSSAHIDAKSSNPDFPATPLHIATAVNNLKLVQLLLNKGADTRCVDAYGRTANDVAKALGYKKVLQLLKGLSRMKFWSITA